VSLLHDCRRLTPELYAIFERGLVGAAMKANAVFFAGGTDAGVIKLIGEVFENASVMAPVVGVAPLPALRQRHLLKDADRRYGYKKPIDYNPACPRADTDNAFQFNDRKTGQPNGKFVNVALNPNQSHFICVDNDVPDDGFPFACELKVT
jgi:hypothetical protein